MPLFDGADLAGNSSVTSTVLELAEQVSGLLLDELHNIIQTCLLRLSGGGLQQGRHCLTFGAETPSTRLMSLGSTWLYRRVRTGIRAVDRVLANGLTAEQLLASRPPNSRTCCIGPPESEDGREACCPCCWC